MTTKTRTDLINSALGHLGDLAAGQVPSVEDFDAVDKYVDPLIEELDARQIVTIDDVEAIPSELFIPLGILLADSAKSEFGLASIPAAGGIDPVAVAITRLTEATYARPTGEPLRTEYF